MGAQQMGIVTTIEQYWTTKQVADRLHVSNDCVKKWLGRGILTKTKAGDRTLVSETALQDFLRRSTKQPTTAA